MVLHSGLQVLQSDQGIITDQNRSKYSSFYILGRAMPSPECKIRGRLRLDDKM